MARITELVAPGEGRDKTLSQQESDTGLCDNGWLQRCSRC